MSVVHFLRPEYFVLLLPVWLLVWWLLKGQSDVKRWQNLIEPQLLKHLLVTPETSQKSISAPWYLGVVLSLVILALSGPSWKLKETPFSKDDTKIAILLSTKKSMLTTDLQPSRLERATIKMVDLLQERSDTQTTLIAYSGSAHLVLPLTKDHTILKSFAQALSPDIMPIDGDNIDEALRLAQKELNTKGSTIIVLTDALSPSLVKLAQKRGLEESSNVILWQIATKELSNSSDFEQSASILGGRYAAYSRDGSDVKKVSSLIDKHFRSAAKDDKGHYEDGGYYVIPLIFLLMLLWAREGFMAELWRRS